MTTLRFVHLSDIHFSNRETHIGFSPDTELRRELLRDIRAQCQELAASAVLVTGDIAYAGKPDEFGNAASWLAEVCASAGCKPQSVFVCPGNHDVDRSVITGNDLVTDAQAAIRGAGDTDEHWEAALLKRLQQPIAASVLLSPLAAYNDFAARYGCDVQPSPERYAWEHDFTIEPPHLLRIRGLNSTLLSGPGDAAGTLFLGPRAVTIPRHDDVHYLTMAHHPPVWLRDRGAVEKSLDHGARIQLFGHEHDARIVPGRDWVKVFAGAVNPHRLEPRWIPGYNIIDVSVEHRGDTEFLCVDISARQWIAAPPRFIALPDRDQDVHHSEFRLPIRPRSCTVSDLSLATVADISAPTQESETVEMEGVPMSAQPDFRELVFQFFSLSLARKSEIAGKLNLTENSDSTLQDVQKFKLALARAKERGLLTEVKRMIDSYEEAQ